MAWDRMWLRDTVSGESLAIAKRSGPCDEWVPSTARIEMESFFRMCLLRCQDIDAMTYPNIIMETEQDDPE